MARIGDYIQPGLNSYDPSPYLQARGNATRTIGAGISKAVGDFGDVLKEQREKESEVKATSKLIESYMTLFPDAATSLEPVKNALADKDSTISDRHAMAKNTGSLISAYLDKQQSDAAFGLEKRQVDLQERGVRMEEQGAGVRLDALKSELAEKARLDQESAQTQQLIAPEVLKQVLFKTADMEKAGGAPLISSRKLQEALDAANPTQQMQIAQAALAGLPQAQKAEFRDIDVTLNGQPGKATAAYNPQTGTFDIVPVRGAWGDGTGGQTLPDSSGIAAEVDENGMISEATEQQVKQAARGYLSDPAANMDKVPLGMRNNNPTNIIYPGAGYAQRVGAIGASRNKDAGSSKPGGGSYNQLVFADPVTGMKAGADLAARKYGSGMTSAAELIAGSNGWTPGNNEAAKNIAASMGLKPNDDLRLNEPTRMKSFLKALVTQEHGNSGKLYKDEVYNRALGIGGPNVAAGAVSGTQRAPDQVALSEARVKTQELQQKKLQQEMTGTEMATEVKKLDRQKAIASANRVLGVINKYRWNDKGTWKPNDRLKDAVGFGEKFMGPVTGALSPEVAADQKELQVDLLEADLLNAAKDLKPVSEDEMKQLIARRPEINSPPEVWVRFMSRAEEILKSGLPDGALEGEKAKDASYYRGGLVK